MNSWKKIVLTAAIALTAISGWAQDWEMQGGFRFGVTSGFAGKFIKDERFAIESMIGFRNGGMQINNLFESRKPILYDRLENMYMYFGGGFHAGFSSWKRYYYDYSDPNNPYKARYYGPAFGLDGIIGAEYEFTSVPVSIAVDFKPFFEFYGPFIFRVNFWDFGFHIRYCFGNNQ